MVNGLPPPENIQWKHQDKHPTAWQFEGTDGEWYCMDAEYQDIYEGLHRSGIMEHDLEHRYGRKGTRTYHYHIDLANKTQLNVDTKRSRNVRRATWQQIFD